MAIVYYLVKSINGFLEITKKYTDISEYTYKEKWRAIAAPEDYMTYRLWYNIWACYGITDKEKDREKRIILKRAWQFNGGNQEGRGQEPSYRVSRYSSC